MDSDLHDRGPFGPDAQATLERSDELIGSLMAQLPTGDDIALVSDHGVERLDHILNIAALAARAGRADGVRGMGAWRSPNPRRRNSCEASPGRAGRGSGAKSRPCRSPATPRT